MRTWLLDASVLLASEDVDDAHHEAARSLLQGPDSLCTLDLAGYEVANVAVLAWKDSAAVARLLAMIDAIAQDGGLIRAEPILLRGAVELAHRHGITVYEAAYAAAATSTGARLVSCDVRDLVARGLAVLPADARPVTDL